MRAHLIGERSAGMTAVEIINDSGHLVWAHRWFDEGGSTAGYIAGLCAAYDAMVDCADVALFDGGEIDDDGAPVEMDTETTTGGMLEYDTATGWDGSEIDRSYGQSREIIDALMLADLIPADDEHADYADDDVVVAVATHIKARSSVAAK